MGIYQKRVAKVQEALAVSDFDLMVLFPSSNMLYLSGFYDEPGERMLFLLVPREGQPVFFVPELYEQQVKEESPFQGVRIWKDSEGPMYLLERPPCGLRADGRHARTVRHTCRRYCCGVRDRGETHEPLLL